MPGTKTIVLDSSPQSQQQLTEMLSPPATFIYFIVLGTGATPDGAAELGDLYAGGEFHDTHRRVLRLPEPAAHMPVLTALSRVTGVPAVDSPGVVAFTTSGMCKVAKVLTANSLGDGDIVMAYIAAEGA